MDEIKAKLRKLKAVFFDFDGVFTDNMVYLSERGEESVRCNRSDGYGLRFLDSLGVYCAIVSSEVNPVCTLRAAKLKIECHHKCEDKLALVKSLCAGRGISLSEAAFVGNDINDLACLEAVGVPVVVADAYPEVVAVAAVKLSRLGGCGAVREFCEMVEAAKRS